MSVRALVAQFALAGVLSLLLVSVILAYASRNVGISEATSDAERITFVSATGIVEPLLNDRLLRMDRQALEDMDRAVRKGVLRGALVRVKIWMANGTVAYSDEARLIGKKFDLEEDKVAVLHGGKVKVDVTNLQSPENQYETESKLLEVYQLVKSKQGVPMLFEAYFRYSGVTAVGRRLWARFAPISLGSLALLQLVQIPLAWSMARRLRAGQVQRERLLQHAISASELERRRIASDLHDGVVQELTGVSLGLAAAARSSPAPDPRLGEASASIRESIGSLRSMLVDIYPPNLHGEGLESALEDLLSPIRTRGMTTQLDVQLRDVALERPTVELLYRAAREAVRNVVSHAEAHTLTVTVTAERGTVALVVQDDGRGFVADDMAARRAEGHVGLPALTELVHESGGRLEMRSAPKRGTRLHVVVPLLREVAP